MIEVYKMMHGLSLVQSQPLSLTLFTQRNIVADFLQAKCNFRGKWPFCIFTPLWGLRAAYDVHLRLIEKRIVNFPLVSIEERERRENFIRHNMNSNIMQ